MTPLLLQISSVEQFGQTIINGLAFGAIYALVALSLVLVYKACGILNFANGEMAMFSTYIAYSLLNGLGWPYWLAFAGALAVSALLGGLIYHFLIRPVQSASDLSQLLMTIGLGTLLIGLAGWLWNFESRDFPDPVAGSPLRLGRLIFTQADLLRLGLAVLIAAGLYGFFRFTRWGKALRALAQDSLAARLVGVNTGRLTALSWGLAGMLGAVAGMLVAPSTFLDPLMMSDVAIKAFAAAVLGGLGSLPGAVAGGLLLGIADNLVGVYVGQDLRNALAFAIIIGALILRPTGLFGQPAPRKV